MVPYSGVYARNRGTVGSYLGRYNPGWLNLATGLAAATVPQIKSLVDSMWTDRQMYGQGYRTSLGKRRSTKQGGRKGGAKRVRKFHSNRANGSYTGLVRPRRRARVSAGARRGFQAVWEKGGTTSSADHVGITHGPPQGSIMLAAVGAIWRRLYEKTGFEVASWKAVPEIAANLFDVKYTYIKDAEGTEQVRSLSGMVGTETHEALVILLRNHMLDTVTASDDVFNLVRIQLVPLSSLGYQAFQGSLSLVRMKVKIDFSSTLMTQNRTPGQAAADDSANDVTHNPLVGRIWKVRGNEVKLTYANYSGTHGTVCEPERGISTALPDITISKCNGPADFKNTVSTKRIRLGAGEIMKTSVSHSQFMYLDQLFRKMMPFLRIATGATADTELTSMYFGSSEHIQFEKMVDTQSGTQDITVGYEVNTLVSAYLGRPARQPVARVVYDNI